jgi:hypothetical protein
MRIFHISTPKNSEKVFRMPGREKIDATIYFYFWMAG